MVKGAALAFLAVASLAVLGAFFLGGAVGEVAFALLVPAFPVALIALGACRGGRLGPLAAPLAALLVLLEGSVGGMLLLRGEVGEGPWVGGLPLAAALAICGLWLGPLILVALAYALTFERFVLREEDLRRLRRPEAEAAGED